MAFLLFALAWIGLLTLLFDFFGSRLKAWFDIQAVQKEDERQVAFDHGFKQGYSRGIESFFAPIPPAAVHDQDVN